MTPPPAPAPPPATDTAAPEPAGEPRQRGAIKDRVLTIFSEATGPLQPKAVKKLYVAKGYPDTDNVGGIVQYLKRHGDIVQSDAGYSLNETQPAPAPAPATDTVQPEPASD